MSGAFGIWFFVHVKLIEPATPDGVVFAFAAGPGALSERQTGYDVAWIFDTCQRSCRVAGFTAWSDANATKQIQSVRIPE